MQAPVLDNTSTAVAWLVSHSNTAGLPERIPVVTLPFIIGRSDTTDLRIQSNWVSREHAVIEDDGGAIRARDLGSTNGTFVNGELIQESPLHDGDILRIGDVDLIFSADDAAVSRGSVTEVMNQPAQRMQGLSLTDFVACLRRTQEIALHQAANVVWRNIVDLQTNTTRALYLAITPASLDCLQTNWRSVPLDPMYPQAARLRLAIRMAAIEHVSRSAVVERLFLRIDTSEIDQWDSLVHQLAVILAAELTSARLVLELPANRTYEANWVDQIRGTVEETGVDVAIGAFAGSAAQLRAYSELKPAFVTIRKSMMRVTSGTAEKRFQDVLAQCADLRMTSIVDGSGNSRDRLRWRDWGIAMQLADSDAGPSIRRTTCVEVS